MDKQDLELDLFLTAVYRLSGFDFRKYMKSSIMRRVENRLRLEGLKNISQLTEKVIHHDVFLQKVLDDFSINVTEMFRDPFLFLVIQRKGNSSLKRIAGNSGMARRVFFG